MHQTHVRAALAFAACLPVRLTEQLQESAFADLGIGQLLRRETEWHFLEERLGSRSDRDAVEELLGVQTPLRRMREVGLIIRVPFVRVEAQLVGSRVDDGADQMPKIVIVINEVFRQRIE